MFNDEQIKLMDLIHDVSFSQDGSTRVQVHGSGLIDVYYRPFPDYPDLFEEKKIILTMDELIKICKLVEKIIPNFMKSNKELSE